jgi:hypothetical protein
LADGTSLCYNALILGQQGFSMANTDVEKILREIDALSPDEQQRLRQALCEVQQRLERSNYGPSTARSPRFGWAKQIISLAPDFDEPLVDFREYSE